MRRALAWIAAATLAGCAVGPDYSRPAIDLPQSYPSAAPDTAPPAIAERWWTLYGDTQLDPAYTPFGKITSGLDILTKVAAAGITGPGGDGTGRPTQPVQLESVTVSAA